MGINSDIVAMSLLLPAVVLFALWTVMTARLVYAVIGLALTSVVVTILIFMMDSPIAGVFELSVCAGLIPVIFLAAIGVARKLTDETAAAGAKEQLRRFWPLPALMALGAIVLLMANFPAVVAAPGGSAGLGVQDVLWNLRRVDLVGQIVILLAGAFAVVVLLKESRR